MKNVGLICLIVIMVFSCSDDGDTKRKKTIPKVTTGAVTGITESSASVSGEVTDDGNDEITEKGFVYSSEFSIPTISHEKLVVGGDATVMNDEVDDLDPETMHYVRAYATNSKGTGYGEVVSFTTDEPQPTTVGLVAHYTFEDNTDDQVASHDASPAGTPALTYSFFNTKNQKAVNFSGANYAAIDDTFDYEFKTVCFWVRANAITDEIMVPFVSDNPNKQYGLVGVYIQKDAGGQKVILLNVAGNPVNVPAQDGVWYHVAMVGAAKSYAYYINGSLVASNTFTTYAKSGNGNEDTIIGASRSLTLFMSGSMDNLRIYNRALSADEIAIIANN